MVAGGGGGLRDSFHTAAGEYEQANEQDREDDSSTERHEVNGLESPHALPAVRVKRELR
jgi:hypothetical protein